MNKLFIFLFAGLLVAKAVLGITEKERFNIVSGLFNDGLYTLAAEEIQKFVQEYPQSPHLDSALFMLGMSYYNLKKYARCREALQDLIARFPNYVHIPTAYRFIANSYYKEGKYALAAKYYKRIMDEFPQSEEAYNAYLMYAQCLTQQNLLNDAIKVYREMVLKFPDNPQNDYVYYNLGTIYYTKGDYLNAALYFESLISKYKTSKFEPEALMLTGESLINVGKYAEAITYFERLLNLDAAKHKDKALYRMAYSYYMLGDYNQAARVLRKFLKSYENSTLWEKVIMLMADVQSGLGDYKSAISYLDKISESSSLYDEAFVKKLQYLMDKEQYPEIIKQCQSYIETRKSSKLYDVVIYYYAEANFFIKNYSEAKKYYEIYLADKGSTFRPRVLYRLGLIGVLQNDYASATRYFLMAYETDDKEVREAALYKLGTIFFEQKRYEEAVYKLKEFTTKFPKAVLLPNVLYKLGYAYFYLGSYEDALQAFLHIYSGYPDSDNLPDILVKIGDCYSQLKNYNKAIHFYSIVKKRYKDTKFYPEAIYGLAWAYANLKDYRQAGDHFALFSQLTDDPSRKKEAIYLAATSYENGKYYDYANRYFQLYADTYQDTFSVEAAYHAELNNIRKGAFSEAVKVFEKYKKMLKTSPFGTSAALSAANALMQLNRYADSLKLLLSISSETDSPVIKALSFKSIGDNYYNQNQMDSAVFYYRKALELVKSNPLYAAEITSFLGWAYFKMDATDTAVSLFKQIINRYPMYREVPNIVYKLAMYYYDRKDYAQALKYFLKLKKYAQFHKDAVIYISECYVQLGQDDVAIEELDALARSTADTLVLGDVLLRKGNILFSKGKYAAAQQVYSEIVERDFPSQVKLETLFNLAKTYVRLGNDTAAKQIYVRLSEQNKDTLLGVKALIELGNLYFKLGKYDLAAEVFSRVARFNRSELGAYAQFWMAKCYEKLGDYTRAIREFSYVVYNFEAYPKYVLDAYLEMGTILEKLGNTTDARKTYENMIKKYPDAPQSIEAKKRLAKFIESVKK